MHPHQTTENPPPQDSIIEFLEVAVHHLLFIRGLYPEGVFVRRRKWETIVHMARYPQLLDYIATAIESMRDKIAEVRFYYSPICE